MEILQDTIIKLIVRQGSNSERLAVTLTSGEPGYTTDSHRLYIGDGVTAGGNVVGNLYISDFAGSPGTPPNNSIIGDLAFNTTTRKLYKSNVAGSNVLANWGQVGGVYVSGDNKIFISDTNVITLCALSGSALSPSIVQYPITLSGGKISLPPLSAYTVSEDLLQYPITLSGGKISLPALSAYTVSTALLSSPIFLNAGKIALSPLSAGHVSSDLLTSPVILQLGRIALAPLSAGHVSSDLVASPIFLDAFTRIALSPLSAGNVSSDLLQSPLYLSGGKITLSLSSFGLSAEAPIIISNGKVALSAKIPIDRVSTNTVNFGDGFSIVDVNTSLTIPNFTSFNLLSTTVNIDYVPPALTVLAALSANLDGPIVYSSGKIALSAQVPFQRISTKTITASSGLLAYVDGVNQGTTPINPLSANIVLQTNQLFIRFEGATGNNTYSRGISGIRVGLGQYLFRYSPLPTANIYPFIQIHSLTSHRYTARTMSLTVSSLSVTIVQTDQAAANNFADVEMFLQLNY